MSEFSITIKHAPANPTGYSRGEVLTYPKSDARLLVVGEDDIYLHTFTNQGSYWGIFKAPENLGCIVTLPV